jgi:hypothetical protein
MTGPAEHAAALHRRGNVDRLRVGGTLLSEALGRDKVILVKVAWAVRASLRRSLLAVAVVLILDLATRALWKRKDRDISDSPGILLEFDYTLL